MFDNLWLAATDEEKEGKWRDAYQEVEGKWRVNTGGQKLNTGLARPFEKAWPWYEIIRTTTARLTVTDFGDTRYGEEANCLQFLAYMKSVVSGPPASEGCLTSAAQLDTVAGDTSGHCVPALLQFCSSTHDSD